MDTLTVDLWTFDVGVAAASPEDYAAEMTSRVVRSWDDGADVVVFPEYAWLGLARFVERKDELRGVAELFWGRLWPGVKSMLSREGKAVVLGTVPAEFACGGALVRGDGAGASGCEEAKPGPEPIRNRAPIIVDGREVFQDKMFLTPWEGALRGGDGVQLWRFGGATFAVLICFDIEIPELAAALRGRGVDCILVPSATETMLGVERVGRCASARAVELGCAVGVCHLVGEADCDLVDENVGGAEWYLPSQSAFSDLTREERSGPHRGGFHRQRAVLPLPALVRARALVGETNPGLIKIDISLSRGVFSAP